MQILAEKEICVLKSLCAPRPRARLQGPPPGPKPPAVPAGWARAAGPGASAGHARSRSRLSGMGLGEGIQAHASGQLGRRTISYEPNEQVDRVGNNRWLQSTNPVEVT